MARTSHGGRAGAPEIALPREHISKLIVIRLNDEFVEGVETAEVWPPRGGLPAGEDPFDTKAVVATPEFFPAGASAPSDTRRISVERAFAVSVILHLLLVIVLLTVKFPARSAAQDQVDPLRLPKLMAATPQDPAPPPVLPVPKAYPQSGIRDLEAGKRGPVAAAAPAAQPPKGSPAGEEAKKLTDLASRAGAFHDPPTAQELAAQRRLLGIQAPDLNAITADAARQAAKSGGGGDEGGGFERDGGFVDSGPLSFDTVGYDWGAYAAEMIRKIKRNWDVPALARYGVKGRLTIRFFILKNGRVEGERILSGSGVPPFDNAAFQAISRSSAFRPLPDDLGHDREGVTVTFFYNLRPEDVEYAGKGRPN